MRRVLGGSPARNACATATTRHTPSSNDNQESGQGEPRVDQPRPKDHEALAHLVEQEKQNQHGGHGEDGRQATPAGVQLPQPRPYKGEQGG